MFTSFRQSMAWLHTWFGLALGYVLMACFFFGALSVFDREIDRWALPETRFAPQPMPSFDKVLLPAFARLEADPADYALNMPALHDAAKGPQTPRQELPPDEYWAYTTHRDPVLAIGAGFRVPQPKDPGLENHIHANATIDPRSGAAVPSDQLKIGSQWFYPMHYSLNWQWQNMGIFTVGLAGLVMLVALVSGVIMHRKFFREFFTFRPQKQTQRSLLDLHNLTGVVALPFHFFFAFTGLLIFAGFYYFPVSQFQLKPLHDQHEIIEARETGLPHQRAGIPAPLASVDAMMAEAKRRWAARDMAGEVGFLQLHHLGDANGYVSIYRAGSDRVALVGEAIHFKASSGEVLREEPPRAAVPALNEFLTGLHLQHFEHWLLRWLYVLGGLLGCACIATGFIFFVEKRKRQHAAAGSPGARVVDALAVGCVTGMVIAAVGMLVVNRLLPAGLSGKGEWEQQIFWGLWLLAFVHAALRGAPVAQARINPAWREQCWAIAALALAAVLLNWLSTGDHLLQTIILEPYWAVAGVDLSLLAAAGLAALAARRLARREQRALLSPSAAPETEVVHA
ncbi:PepSY-associated TM helix domain-containing protein [Uliginosibacterium aquaticum]|uniref:PepSY domain-containing protein n=1 Tax=Uliginosibacterium aquaticum TaxID=2731212 RepID=A0ABX2IAS4_9RHOO|nr:PepSY-associated TM helix domain-containing protein [Uliginosibacterium aquaticum]NSL53434.1 PepSY domain-containing protein [Uliginosibacterium aquaticum]